MTKSLSVHSTDELVAHFDTQAAAMKSYWYLNHKEGDESRIDEDVCNDLKVLADSLSGGSTVDMEQSNEITCAIASGQLGRHHLEGYWQRCVVISG